MVSLCRQAAAKGTYKKEQIDSVCYTVLWRNPRLLVPFANNLRDPFGCSAKLRASAKTGKGRSREAFWLSGNPRQFDTRRPTHNSSVKTRLTLSPLLAYIFSYQREMSFIAVSRKSLPRKLCVLFHLVSKSCHQITVVFTSPDVPVTGTITGNSQAHQRQITLT